MVRSTGRRVGAEVSLRRGVAAASAIAVVSLSVNAGPAAASSLCTYTQVASSPGAAEFVTGDQLQALLTGTSCDGGNDLVRVQVAGTFDLYAGSTLATTGLAWHGPADLVIAGNGAGTSTIDAQGLGRVLDSDSAGLLSFQDVTVANATTLTGGGAVQAQGPVTVTDSDFSGNSAPAGEGGAILAQGRLVVTGSTFSDNRALGGAAAYIDAPVDIAASTFTGNTATSPISPGTIYAAAGITVSDSTFSGNTAAGTGGVIHALSGLTMTRSSLTANSAAYGGAIYSVWGTTIEDSTISGNSATQSGGGILGDAGLDITNSTLVNNTAVTAGGAIADSGGVTITSSTLAGNSAPQGAAIHETVRATLKASAIVTGPTHTTGSVTTSGAGGQCELVGSARAVSSSAFDAGDTSCAPEGGTNLHLTTVQLNLGPLGDNTGPTATMLPGAGSLLIGGAAGATGLPALDQRGVPRGTPAWIGSVQTGAALIPAFAAASPTSAGFTIQVTNFDPAWTWTVTPSAGAASISATGLITVTGLAPTQLSLLTVATSRAAHDPGSAQTSGSAATGAALVPALGTPTAVTGGFTLPVTNYDPAWAWTATASAGTAALSPTGILSVTGLAAGQQATITATTARSGHAPGSARATGTARAAVVARAKAVSGRSKLKVSVTPFCHAQYQVSVQKLVRTAAGSDEPTVTWNTLRKHYRTSGKRTSSLTINLPKGTYRAVVAGACDLDGATTGSVRLSR